jgi:hypothetical protein
MITKSILPALLWNGGSGMRKHALPVYVALLLSIIIAAKLGYFPSHPAQSETKILNAEEFSQLWVKSDIYKNKKVDFGAEVLNIVPEAFSDYLLVSVNTPNWGKKELIIIVNCQYPELKTGDSIQVQGYVDGCLTTRNHRSELHYTPLIVGTAIEKSDTVPAVNSRKAADP